MNLECLNYTQRAFYITLPITGFSLGRLHMGGICPPHMGGTSAGGQSVNGGTHEGEHIPYVGANFERLYHKLKVLLLLS